MTLEKPAAPVRVRVTPVPTPSPVPVPDPSAWVPPVDVPPDPAPLVITNPQFSTSPAPAGKTLITRNDFTYLGRIGMPIWEEGWSFSRGAMTGRIVNGEQRLFVAGAESNIERMFEVALPEPVIATTSATLPRARTVRAWGDVSLGRAVGINPDQVKYYIRGVKWLEDRQRLLWNFTLWYGAVPGWANPTIGLSELRDDGTIIVHGPWRTDIPYDVSVGPVVDVPAAYGLGRYAVASPQYTQVGFLGANLHAFDVPADSTPADVPAMDATAQQATIPTRRLLYHDLDHPQRKLVDAAGVYHCSLGYTETPDQAIALRPAFGGGREHAAETMDNWLTAVWIDTPTKTGVLYLGTQQRQGHNGYGNYPRVNDRQPPVSTCWHGKPVTFGGGIGNSGTSVVLAGAFYNPTDLGAVARGDVPPYGVLPYEEFTADTFANHAPWVPQDAAKSYTNPGGVGNFTYRLGGSHFEPTTGRLYIVENAAEYEAYCLAPIVHVFQL